MSDEWFVQNTPKSQHAVIFSSQLSKREMSSKSFYQGILTPFSSFSVVADGYEGVVGLSAQTHQIYAHYFNSKYRSVFVAAPFEEINCEVNAIK